jgi:putative tryptophan/tyrosine transport system substrate-binding protein
MRRRDFMTLVGGAAAAWPAPARAQQASMPTIGFVNSGSADGQARFVAAFRKGLDDAGFVEGQTVAVEYHWLEGRNEGVAPLIADLVRRRVAAIATPGFTAATLAAKAATSTIPIVFSVTDDPVKMGLVASLARPGGNATGIKRLQLLHDLVPKAVRVAVLVNPANVGSTEATLREAQQAAANIGLQIQILKAATIAEIDAVFASFARERPDALFLAGDGFFLDRRVQFATLTARDRIPASGAQSDFVKAGILMSYGTDYAEMFRQVGDYTGRILKGENPAGLPVKQSTKFEFLLNLQTARALNIEVPPGVLSVADEVIE